MEDDLTRSSGSKELSETSSECEENSINEPYSSQSDHLQTSAPISKLFKKRFGIETVPLLRRKVFQTIIPAFLWILLFEAPYPVNIFKKTEKRYQLRRARCKNLRTRLNEQRSFKPHLCDATIQTTSGKYLHVHKAVLASCSQYFEEKFYSRNETSSGPMEITNISPEVLSSIVDYMYDEPITLTEENIQETTNAAEYLQIADLINTCHEFLAENENRENSTRHQSSDKPSSVDDFSTNADKALTDNLEEVFEYDDFTVPMSDERVDLPKLTRPKQQTENLKQDSDEGNQDLPGIPTFTAPTSEKGSSKVNTESAEEKENLVEKDSTGQESKQHESQRTEGDEASSTSTETPFIDPSPASSGLSEINTESAEEKENLVEKDSTGQESKQHESQRTEGDEASSTSTETPFIDPSPASSGSSKVNTESAEEKENLGEKDSTGPGQESKRLIQIQVGSAQDKVDIAAGDIIKQNINADRNKYVDRSKHITHHHYHIITPTEVSRTTDQRGSTEERSESSVGSFTASTSNDLVADTPPSETISQIFPDEDSGSTTDGAAESSNKRNPPTETNVKQASERKPTLSEAFESEDPSGSPSNVRPASGFLEKYKVSLKTHKYEEAKTMTTAITSMIEDNIDATAKDVKEFGRKLREKKLFLESIAIFDAASTMFEKRGKTEENLKWMRICVGEMKDTNIAMIGDDDSTKVTVKNFVIPLMREKLRHIEDTSLVSEQFKCRQVCLVLHCIEHSEHLVDEWEESEKTLRFALTRMKDVFEADDLKFEVYGLLLHNLGVVCHLTSRFEEAASFYKQAIDAFKAATDYSDEEERKKHIASSESNLKNVQQKMK